MTDNNLWDSIQELDHDGTPAPQTSGWGLGKAISNLRSRGDSVMNSNHGPTQMGLPTPPTSKSSHETDPYSKSSLSGDNGHGGAGIWNRFGGQQQTQEEEREEIERRGGSSTSDGNFWNNLGKNHESEDEDASYMNTNGDGQGGIWNRVTGGQTGDLDESDYDTDAGDDDWEQQKIQSLRKSSLPGSMLDNATPSPQKQKRSSPVPTPPPPPQPIGKKTAQEETDDEMLDESNASFDDADSVALAGGGDVDLTDDLGGLGAFLDKGNEKAFEAEMTHMMRPDKDDKSMADMSAIEGSVAPGEVKHLIQQRMQQRMDMSFGKSVCAMSLNPQEVETKERRPWRQQKHLRRGSQLGAMPAGQLAMLGAMAGADDEDSEEEDLLYQVPDERPVGATMGGFDDVWKDGDATVMTEMPEIPLTAVASGSDFLAKVPNARKDFLSNGGANPPVNPAKIITSSFAQTAEEMFPEELGDKVKVEDLFALQNMKSAQPQLQPDPHNVDSAHSSKKREKNASSHRNSGVASVPKPVVAALEKHSSRSREQKSSRNKLNGENTKDDGSKNENFESSRRSTRRSTRRRPKLSDENDDEHIKSRSSHRGRSHRDINDEDSKARKRSPHRKKTDGGNEDLSRKSPRQRSSRRSRDDDLEKSTRKKSSHRRENRNGQRSSRSRDNAEIDADLEGSRRRLRKQSSRRPRSDSDGPESSRRNHSRRKKSLVQKDESNGRDLRKQRSKSKYDDAVEQDFRGDLRASRVSKKGTKGGEDGLEGSTRHRDRKANSRSKEDEEDKEGIAGLKVETKSWRQPKDTKCEKSIDDVDGTEKHENSSLSRLEARSRAAASSTKKSVSKKSDSYDSRQGTLSTGTGTTAETSGSLEFDDQDHRVKELKRTGSIVAKHAAEAAKQPKKRGRIFVALGLKKNNHAKLEEDENANAGLLKQEIGGKARRQRSSNGNNEIPGGPVREKTIQPRGGGSKSEKANLLGSERGKSDGWVEKEDVVIKKDTRRRSASVPQESAQLEEKRRRNRRSTSVPRPKHGEVESNTLCESSRSHGRKKSSRDSSRRIKSYEGEPVTDGKTDQRKKTSHRNLDLLDNAVVQKKEGLGPSSHSVVRKKSRRRPNS